ncbi:MAG: protein kinase domain-containing protein [Planctomycetota bacterium]|jgi:tetratricopeptide (TPR) repeat protein/predicted Ser/Thr protein kinase
MPSPDDAMPGAQPGQSKPVPPPPEERYEVLRELGRGSFGVVWLARRKKQGIDGVEDDVAVKRLIATDAPVEEGIKRFVREIEAIRKLNHQCIVTLLDFDRDEYGPYLVMEYVEGRDLSQLLAEKGKFTVEEVIHVGERLCEALNYAHTRPERVIHRDLKLTNVIFSDREDIPKLVDFGLARQTTGSEDLSTGLTTAGTWDYASPEQRLGRPVGPPADIFSLGATLYQLATGKSPGYRIVPDQIPAALRDVILRATAEEPHERYGAMDDMRQALLAARGTAEEEAPAPVAQDPTLCPLCGKHPLAGYRFCPNTGRGIFQVCSVCKAENPLQTKFCIQCGADIEAVDQALESLKLAKEREEDRDFEGAIRLYERAMETLHNHRPARAIYDKARKAVDRLTSFRGQRKQVTEQAEKKMAVGEFDEAERIVQEALADDPSYAPYQEYIDSIPRRKRGELLKKARKLFAEWDLESAFQLAQDAVAVPVPGKREAERFLGTVRRKRSDFRELAEQVTERLRTGHYREVLDLCDAATEQFPNHPRLEVWSAEARERLGDHTRLISQGNDAIVQSQWKQAESYFKEAHRVCPQEPGGREGIKRARQGHYDSTLESAREASDQRRFKTALDLYVQAQQVAPEAKEAKEGEESCRRRLRRKKVVRFSLAAVLVLLLLSLGAVGPIAGILADGGNLELAVKLHETFGPIMFNRNSLEKDFAAALLKKAEELEAKDLAAAQEKLQPSRRGRSSKRSRGSGARGRRRKRAVRTSRRSCATCGAGRTRSPARSRSASCRTSIRQSTSPASSAPRTPS